jgi:carboxypeptidase family protein
MISWRVATWRAPVPPYVRPRCTLKWFVRSKLSAVAVAVGVGALSAGVAIAAPHAPMATASDCRSAGPSPSPTRVIGAVPLGVTGSPSSPPCPTTGALAGVLTTSAGKPLVGATVDVQGAGTSSSTQTDGTGAYRLGSLPPGQYTLLFQIPGTGLTEYVPRRQTPAGAGSYRVTAGQTSTVDERALATGTLTGHFRDAAGKPVHAEVLARNVTTGSLIDTTTDNAGGWTAAVFVGTYTVEYTYHGYLQQYAAEAVDPAGATRYRVDNHATAVVDDVALPTGSLGGTVKESNGTPAVGAELSVFDTRGRYVTGVRTGADGRYHIDVLTPDTYHVQITASDGIRAQWAYHQTDLAKAAAFTVSAGHRTTVDDTLLPAGSLTVHAVNAANGSALTDFCGYLQSPDLGRDSDHSGCTTTGVLTLPDLQWDKGEQLTVTDPNGSFVRAVVTGIAVVPGNVGVTARMQPGATIVTSAVDHATGTALPGVCVTAVPTHATVYDSPEVCADDHNVIRLTGLAAGTYRLFARATDHVHGAQWVAVSGGTGDLDAARQVTVTPGATTAVAPIRFDAAGSIAGRVSDRATGAPVAACVTVVPASAFNANRPCTPGAMTGSDGRFTIAGLGPYAWPVEFAAYHGYAWQWSGGQASRTRATPITVHSGQTSTVSSKLVPGTSISGSVSSSTGRPIAVVVFPVNAETGDPAGGYGLSDPGYQLTVKPQTIKLGYDPDEVSLTPVWYWNASDLDSATPVVVGGTALTIDLTGN